MQKHAQRQFFRDIHNWIKAGCPEINNHEFSPGDGLCINYNIWCITNNKQRAQKPFHFVGNSPFNSTPSQCYVEVFEKTIYQNAERLAYIKKHS